MHIRFNTELNETYVVRTPAFADSLETTAALCVRIGARHMFRIELFATGDIAIGDQALPTVIMVHSNWALL